MIGIISAKQIRFKEVSVPFSHPVTSRVDPTAQMNRASFAMSRYPSRPQDWEKHKAEIENLWRKDKLKDVMYYMQRTHNFNASYATLYLVLLLWSYEHSIPFSYTS